MAKKVMFKFAEKAVLGFPPMPEKREGGLPPANILGPLIELNEHRAKCIARPPNGYGSLVGPKKAVVNEEFVISATFPPNPFDESDTDQLRWQRATRMANGSRFPVKIDVLSTNAFDVTPRTQSFDLGTIHRVVGIDFIVRPLSAAWRPQTIKLLLTYPCADPVEFSFAVRVRSRTYELLQKLAVLIGIIVGLLTVLKAFGWI